jgi:asparagine synthase (glutamine-hydrolysing)
MHDYLKFKDEPIGVPNEVALYLLFKEIKKSATVVLAGEGADEIFGGYGGIFRAPFDYMRGIIVGEEKNFVDFFLEKYGYFTEEDMSIMREGCNVSFREHFKELFDNCPRDFYNKISYVFLKLHLPGLLLRSDVSSMANAIESRVPFLDHNLVQSVYSLPFDYKNKFKDLPSFKESVGLSSKEISEKYDIPKHMLKEIAKDSLPEEIIKREKQGFPLPLNKWFGEDYIEKMSKILLNENNNISKFVNLEKLRGWLNNENIGQKIWMLYSLEIWLGHVKEKYGSKLIW